MNSSNTVFFSTANSGYVCKAAASLLTIRKYVPEAKLFILSSGMSHEERQILYINDIDYHEVDLSNKFTKTWDYPIDCYYIFAGPEILINLGYTYSVYIDGDVLCDNHNIFLEDLECIAGVESAPVHGEYVSIFGNDWDSIRQRWKLEDSLRKKQRINAGVVYFNNASMKELQLFKKASNLYKKSIEYNIPRKGDDSLFSLLQYVYYDRLKIKILPPKYNFVLQFNDWVYPVKDLIFFHFSIDKPWKEKPYDHDDEELSMFNPYVKKWISVHESVKIVRRRFGKLKDIIHHQILAVRGLRKNILIKSLNIRKPPIRLYWWHDHGSNIANFGDEVTKDILMRVFGYRSEYAPPHEATLAGAGSILEILSDVERQHTLSVWGSGFIREPDENLKYRIQNAKFHAVRGEITKRRLKIDKTNFALGDPGILASVIYDKAAYNSDKIGVVVHYIDAGLPIVRAIKYDPRFMIISPLDTPENVARNISSCRMILSSSLHGLIFADSFNIPNAHIQLSDNVVGGSYKFRDYYSGTGREYKPADASRIFDSDYLKELRLQYIPVDNLRAHQRRMIRAFPKI